jgi:hypothetical protein
MAKSQFEPKLTVSGSTARGVQPNRTITVGGPLEIPASEDYEHPIVVQFQVVQVPRGEHDDEDVIRRRGRGEEVLVNGKPDPDDPRWSGSVTLGPLVTGKADVIKKETRGVAIAVLERKNQFAFDTITWCDEIELVDAKAPPGKKPKGKPSPPKKPAGKAAPAKKPASKASPAKKPRKASPAKRASGR